MAVSARERYKGSSAKAQRPKRRWLRLKKPRKVPGNEEMTMEHGQKKWDDGDGDCDGLKLRIQMFVSGELEGVWDASEALKVPLTTLP